MFFFTTYGTVVGNVLWLRTFFGGWGLSNKVGAHLHGSLGPASNLQKIFYAHIGNYTPKAVNKAVNMIYEYSYEQAIGGYLRTFFFLNWYCSSRHSRHATKKRWLLDFSAFMWEAAKKNWVGQSTKRGRGCPLRKKSTVFFFFILYPSVWPLKAVN